MDLTIIRPRIIISGSQLPKKKKTPTPQKSPFKINRISIRDGEFFYREKKLNITILKLNVRSKETEDDAPYQIESPHLKIKLPIGHDIVTLEGQVKAEVVEKEDHFRITRFNWDTQILKLTANGKVFKNGGVELKAFIQDDPWLVIEPLIGSMAPKGYIYGSARINKTPDNPLLIDGRFRFNSVVIDEEEFQNFTGVVSYNTDTKALSLNSRLFSGQTESRLQVNSHPRLVTVSVKNIKADKLCRVIDIYDDAPLGGILKKADIKIRGREIEGVAEAEFDEENKKDFNIRGNLTFAFNTKTKRTRFQSDNLETRMGSLAITGLIKPKEHLLSVKLRAKLSELDQLHDYTSFFAHLDLDTWKLNRGNGSLTLDLKKTGKFFDFDCDFAFKDFYSDQEPIASMTGELRARNSVISGQFDVQDPNLSGKAGIVVDDDGTTIQFKEVEGQSEKIFNILDLDIPVKGKMTGTAKYATRHGQKLPAIEGEFQSPLATFTIFDFHQAKGSFKSDTKSVALDNLEFLYHQGKGNADIFLDYKNLKYKVGADIKNIDLMDFSGQFNGKADMSFAGEGAFDTDPIAVEYRMHNVNYYEDRSFDVTAEAKIFTNFSDFDIQSSGELSTTETKSPFSIHFKKETERYSGSFNLKLKDINQLTPWKNNTGEMDLEGQILTGPDGEINMRGLATFQGKALAFPNFSHALRDFQGFVTFENGKFSLKSLQGEMGEGKVEGNGFVEVDNGELKNFLLSFSGKEMTLYPMDRTSCTLNADINIKLIDKRLLLQGNLNFLSALWEREIDDGISFYTNPNVSSEESKIMDMLDFDLKLTGSGDIRMINSFGNMSGTFDLHLGGTPGYPVITGTIQSRQGQVYFSDRKFNLIRAKLVFNNKYAVDPILHMQSESFIKNYRIKFNVNGTASQPKPVFQSSPPLPQQDILALLSLGELFKRPASSEMSSQIGSTGLATTALIERIQKRAKKFGIDILKIDPIIAGTSREGASRLTVGTNIAKGVILVYSTNISNVRQEIYYIQYQLSPSLSLIGMRNEDGHFSLDLRFRKRN